MKERKTWRWHNGTLNKDDLSPILLFSNQQDLTSLQEMERQLPSMNLFSLAILSLESSRKSKNGREGVRELFLSLLGCLVRKWVRKFWMGYGAGVFIGFRVGDVVPTLRKLAVGEEVPEYSAYMSGYSRYCVQTFWTDAQNLRALQRHSQKDLRKFWVVYVVLMDLYRFSKSKSANQTPSW